MAPSGTGTGTGTGTEKGTGRSASRGLIIPRRHRIETARVKRVALEDSFGGQPETQQPVLLNGLCCINRAGRLESAGRWHERRDEPFIESGR